MPKAIAKEIGTSELFVTSCGSLYQRYVILRVDCIYINVA